jgi:hypothetical protein
MSREETLVRDIAHEYIRARHPEQEPVLAEYFQLSELGSEIELPKEADQFIEAELLQTVLAPLVVGVVSGYLANLAFAYRQRILKSRDSTKIERDPPVSVLLAHEEVRRSARRATVQRLSSSGQEDLVLEVISFTEDYVQSRYETPRSSSPEDVA